MSRSYSLRRGKFSTTPERDCAGISVKHRLPSRDREDYALFMYLPIRKHRYAGFLFAILSLSCAGAHSAAAAAAGGGIRLSEVLYDSRGRGQLEYLEIHNAGSEPVD